VFQSYALYPRMTAEKNLTSGCGGRVPSEIARRVEGRVASPDQAAAQPPPGGVVKASASGWRSAGAGSRRRRLSFDEPLSNLDAKLRTELRVELKKLHNRLGSTMIYVTHDQIEALTLADRIAVMHGGVIQQLATPKEIYRRPINRFVAGFVGSPAMNFVAGTLAADAAAWCSAPGRGTRPPRRLRLRRPAGRWPQGRARRPSRAQLDVRRQRPSVLPVEVSLIDPMGADLAMGTVGGDRLDPHRLRRQLQPGQKVAAWFQPAHASCSTPGAANASEGPPSRAPRTSTREHSNERLPGSRSSSTARGIFLPLEPQLEALAAIGFDAVEPYRGAFGDDAAGFRRKIDAVGLKSHRPPAGRPSSPTARHSSASPRPGLEAAILPYLAEAAADDARRLGGLRRDLSDNVAAPAGRGLKLAWHTHAFEYVPLADGFRPIEALIAAPGMYYEPDIGWIARRRPDRGQLHPLPRQDRRLPRQRHGPLPA
jgi:multiple sugar transport system ATP-binding protein